MVTHSDHTPCHVPVVVYSAFPFYLLLFRVGCERGCTCRDTRRVWNTYEYKGSGWACATDDLYPLSISDALLKNATEWAWWQMSLVPALRGSGKWLSVSSGQPRLQSMTDAQKQNNKKWQRSTECGDPHL